MAATKKPTKKINKWSSNVTSDATHPDPGLFKQDAETIATHLGTQKVAPKGPVQGMEMLNFYINRAGKNLSAERHQVLEHAKQRLHQIIEDERFRHAAS